MSISIKKIPSCDKPRERLLIHGVEHITNEELISIILGKGSKKNSVKEIANQLLSTVVQINDLRNTSIQTLMKIHGIGYAKGLSLIAALELGRRVYYEEEKRVKIKLDNPATIYQYIKSYFLNKKQEYFYVLYLDTKKKLIEYRLLFVGTLNRSVVHPREIFKYAYLCSAASIICIHNHPSGDVEPSLEDIQLTKILVEIGKVQGILVVDHLVIGINQYYSFFEHNQMS